MLMNTAESAVPKPRLSPTARRVRRLLALTGWTQTMLAEELGITQAHVSRMAAGKRPALGSVLLLLERLEQDVAFMIKRR